MFSERFVKGYDKYGLYRIDVLRKSNTSAMCELMGYNSTRNASIRRPFFESFAPLGWCNVWLRYVYLELA